MEMEEIHTQVCKFPRLDNGVGRIPGSSSSKLGQYFNEEEQKDDREITARGRSSVINSAVDISNEIGYARLRGWHHSSRIFRVSRASGGKDRHSKVLTSKGLRDRRVRLSVSTAIQFYDLQDRLGYDQPSKAVEWLIKAAADSISELPSLNTPFPITPPKQLSDEYHHQQQQHLSKSACSSTSETSKGSGLTLSKSDVRVNNRVKARERARERSAAKEKKDSTNDYMNANHISENSSFTELLGGNNDNANTGSQTSAPSTQHNSFFFQKSPAMDYFNPARSLAHHSSLFSTQMQPQSMAMPQPFTLSVENNNNSTHNNHGNNFHELQHFSLIPENLIPVTNGNEYNLNFSISSTSSSGIAAGFNSRGTLQSNSSPPQQQPSSFFPHHYFQRFPSMDGSSNLPQFMGTTAAAASSNMDNIQHHHLFPASFDGCLQLYYNDHPDNKGKGKN